MPDADKISHTRQNITILPFKLGDKSPKTDKPRTYTWKNYQRTHKKALKNPEPTDKELGNKTMKEVAPEGPAVNGRKLALGTIDCLAFIGA